MAEVEGFRGGSANMAGTGGVPIPTWSSGVSSSSGSDPISPGAAAATRGPMAAYVAVGDVTCETGNGFRVNHFLFRERPDMMSALEGDHGKADVAKEA